MRGYGQIKVQIISHYGRNQQRWRTEVRLELFKGNIALGGPDEPFIGASKSTEKWPAFFRGLAYEAV